jgi:UDP-N-acetylmuramyl pentapeptide phosphotransferase/UDP-N-acetylglucosamine-1-phosphate transferase
MFNILDIPNSRKIHKIPIVRIGGLTIILTFLLFLFINYLFLNSADNSLFGSQKILAIIIGSLFYFLLGIHDDIYKSSPVLRLIIQFLIAFIVSLLGINFSDLTINLPYFGSIDFTLPSFWSHLLTCFWIVGITNAINWLDGLDGLAAGYSFFASISILITSFIFGNTAGIIIFSIFSGSIIGFLIRNFKPAFYIMGDCGSYFLGFFLSTGVIYFSSNGFENSVPFQYIIILFSLPIFDMIFVILNRFFKNLNPLKPDANHIHHRMIRANITYNQMITIIYSYSIFSVILANNYL